MLVAEADASDTVLVGQTLREARLRERFHLNVAGIWRRGAFHVSGPDTRIVEGSVLLLAGRSEDMQAYDQAFGVEQPPSAFVVILGGGRVGRATAEGLSTKGIDHCIVEKLAGRARPGTNTIVGDAADLAVLKAAGLDRATTVAVTTHDDDMNVYLTLYCRRLRPDLQILSRTTSDRNVSTLYRAGANVVLSYASMGANAMINMLRQREMVLLGEGLDVFKVPVPKELEGRTLIDADIPSATGCNLLAVINEGQPARIPDANTVLPRGAQLILIGNQEAESAFFKRYRL
jgi:Trk K+ transport system NAD-binding subunit